MKFLRKMFKDHSTREYDAIVCGWSSSGSTLLYQILSSLNLAVYKTHGNYDSSFGVVFFTIRDPRDIIVSNAKRASMTIWQEDREKALFKELDRFINDKNIEAYYSALQHRSLIIRYELFLKENLDVTIGFLCDQFRITCQDELVQRIKTETSIDSNQRISERLGAFDVWDEKTLVHGMHITNNGKPGAWRIDFTEKVKIGVKDALGDLIVELGYAKNKSW